ncbi:UAA transporter [Abortiporus biennis]|nr:UAA transporter [Abortiporus biennis]
MASSRKKNPTIASMEKRRNAANQAAADLVLRPPAISNGTKDAPDIKPLKHEKTTSKAVALSLVDMSFVLTLVFGGCCTNVWAYEYLLKLDSRLGTTLTFSQMLFVTITSLPSFLTITWFFRIIPLPKLKPRQVPLTQWFLQVFVHTTGSLLNNWAFAFSVPLTVQIVFRSAGLAVSMLFGYLFLHRRYWFLQIASVSLVSLGVILATLSRPSPNLTNSDDDDDDFENYTFGIGMLTVSLFLTGLLGILQERTYTKYGPCWKEGVFYTHFLSLPVFTLMIPHVKYGYKSLALATLKPTPTATASPSSSSLSSLFLLNEIIIQYSPYWILAGNLLTQLICVSGVNQLTSRVSSVSTNIVLTTRKAISLCFSVWWFGNEWNTELGVGASMVFVGSLLYTLVTSRSSGGSSRKSKKKVE